MARDTLIRGEPVEWKGDGTSFTGAAGAIRKTGDTYEVIFPAPGKTVGYANKSVMSLALKRLAFRMSRSSASVSPSKSPRDRSPGDMSNRSSRDARSTAKTSASTKPARGDQKKPTNSSKPTTESGACVSREDQRPGKPHSPGRQIKLYRRFGRRSGSPRA